MKVMLDSGAYSAWRANKTIDIDVYIQFVKDNKHLINHYVNLDVIGDGKASYENFRYMKSEGMNPIPVYHAGTPLKYLEKYIDQSDYVAIGALTNMSTPKRIENLDMLWSDYLTDSTDMPIRKFHGMGFTTGQLMTRYPWFSVDSSTWLTVSRMGIILTPRVKDGRFNYRRAPVRVEISSRSPHKKEDCGHFETLSPFERKQVQDYFESYGFKIGKSTWDEEGEETKEEVGLCNDFFLRDELNALYFMEVIRNLPTWPYPFTHKAGKSSLWEIKKHDDIKIEGDGTPMRIYCAGVGVNNSRINELFDFQGLEWLRMVSYYHKSEYRNVFKVKEGE